MSHSKKKRKNKNRKQKHDRHNSINDPIKQVENAVVEVKPFDLKDQFPAVKKIPTTKNAEITVETHFRLKPVIAAFVLASLVIIVLGAISIYQWKLMSDSGTQLIGLRHQIEQLKVELTTSHKNYDNLLKDHVLLKNISGAAQVLSENNNLQIKQLTTQLSRLEKRRLYTVKSGETLEDISRRFYGNPEKYLQIIQSNALEEPAFLKEGDLLVIDTE